MDKKQAKILFIDFPLILLFGVPAFVVHYIWQSMMVGWCAAEYYFDPDSFTKKYGSLKNKAQ